MEDLDALLDTAFGLVPPVPQPPRQRAPSKAARRFRAAASGSSGSLASAQLSPSPSPSPGASPAHVCPYGSPAMSSSSTQWAPTWGSPPHEAASSPFGDAGSWSPVRAVTEQPAAQGPAPLQQQQTLASLPQEVLQRVLCFLSAESLTTLAQASRLLRELCSEPVLWRRLFCARWGRVQQGALDWKARFMERDLAELRAAGGAGPQPPSDTVQALFVQAHLAKRQQALGREAVEDLALVQDEVAARVQAWRQSRGFADQLPKRPTDLGAPAAGGGARGACGASSGCAALRQPGGVMRRQPAGAAAPSSSGHAVGQPAAPPSQAGAGAAVSAGGSPRQQQQQQQQQQARRQRRRFTQIGNVFCDELTGWLHTCDESCSEKVVEPSSGLLVCPISGQVFQRMLTCAEEEALGEGAREEGAREEEWGGERGRLARAFAAGYECDSERELERTCGVRFAR